MSETKEPGRRKVELAHKILEQTHYEDDALDWMFEHVKADSCAHTQGLVKKVMDTADSRINELSHQEALVLASNLTEEEMKTILAAFATYPTLQRALLRLDQVSANGLELLERWLRKIVEEVR